MNKTDETLKMLEDGINGLIVSENYKQYLKTMAKFHVYSPNNCLLISMQKPDATLVAGYNTWNEKFHRYVKKGEKGISIISPSEYTYEKPVFKNGQPVFDENGALIKEKVKRRGFRTTTVFDISQTEGEPLPEIVNVLSGPVEGFYDYLNAIDSISPVPIRFDDINQNGYYSANKQEIVIKRGMPEEQTIKTLLHECAHALLGHGKDDGLDKETREVQAESVAFVCCNALGIDSSDYSFGYIAGWSKEISALKENLNLIRLTSHKMIEGVQTSLNESMKLRLELSQKLEPEGMALKIS